MSLKRKAVDVAGDASKKAKSNASITSFFGAPKSSPSSKASSDPSAAATKATPFDKDAFVAKLSSEQSSLLNLELTTLHDTWLAALAPDLLHPSFLSLKRFLASERSAGTKVFPPKEDVYAWSRHTPLNTVKAVILGQDPYHNVNQAHGLCFSVRPPTPAPPSLKNMYIALKNDYPSFRPPPKNAGLLTPWADRGVLLLNTCLTVRAHAANSHANKGWERFTQRVVDVVAQKRTKGVVFMAWGNHAQKRCVAVEKSGKHVVLKSVHPSPLSAHNGFFGCGHFKKANEWLAGRYGEDGVIDWDLGSADVDGKAAATKASTAIDENTAEKAAVSQESEKTLDADDEALEEEMLEAVREVEQKVDARDAEEYGAAGAEEDELEAMREAENATSTA
nr:hypothetical protein B0A51_13585 [Rachicladosporium sp. CCFEE 5018]